MLKKRKIVACNLPLFPLFSLACLKSEDKNAVKQRKKRSRVTLREAIANRMHGASVLIFVNQECLHDIHSISARMFADHSVSSLAKCLAQFFIDCLRACFKMRDA